MSSPRQSTHRLRNDKFDLGNSDRLRTSKQCPAAVFAGTLDEGGKRRAELPARGELDALFVFEWPTRMDHDGPAGATNLPRSK
jgi:hypothetical protein